MSVVFDVSNVCLPQKQHTSAVQDVLYFINLRPAEFKSVDELFDEVITQTGQTSVAADLHGMALNPATGAATWLSSLVRITGNTSITLFDCSSPAYLV
ncbi:hypothetical protein E4U35_000153 [Claviceps purpurea]|nr:hypothetical protein E4U35_000153 [Claviceps purpurea]